MTSVGVRSLFERYAALLRQGGALRFVAYSFAARMPIGTLGLATLLHVRALTGSMAFAGSVVGAQFVAAAVTAPLLGRWIDLRGPRGVLVMTGTVTPVAILVVLMASSLALPRAAIAAAAAIVGAFSPPVTVLVRTLWRHRFTSEDQRRVAFAIDAVLLECAYTLGPALIAIVVAISSAQIALGVAWVLATAAVPLLYFSRALPWWRHQPNSERRLLGPLVESRLVWTYASTFALTASFGALEVSYTGFAIEAGTTSWGPALIAINSIGSAVGGIVYGGVHFALPIERQLPRIVAIFALSLAIQFFFTSPWSMMPAAFLAGLLIAPAMTAVTLLVSKYAPAQHATESFTWSSTAIVTGIGIGTALGGAVVERFGASKAFLFAAACAMVSAAIAITLRRGANP